MMEPTREHPLICTLSFTFFYILKSSFRMEVTHGAMHQKINVIVYTESKTWTIPEHSFAPKLLAQFGPARPSITFW
jgi:hypothetical protein